MKKFVGMYFEVVIQNKSLSNFSEYQVISVQNGNQWFVCFWFCIILNLSECKVEAWLLYMRPNILDLNFSNCSSLGRQAFSFLFLEQLIGRFLKLPAIVLYTSVCNTVSGKVEHSNNSILRIGRAFNLRRHKSDKQETTGYYSQ